VTKTWQSGPRAGRVGPTGRLEATGKPTFDPRDGSRRRSGGSSGAVRPSTELENFFSSSFLKGLRRAKVCREIGAMGSVREEMRTVDAGLDDTHNLKFYIIF